MQGTYYRSLPVVVVLGDLRAHVLVPELAELADGVVLAGAKEGVAGVFSQVVPCQLVRLQGKFQQSGFHPFLFLIKLHNPPLPLLLYQPGNDHKTATSTNPPAALLAAILFPSFSLYSLILYCCAFHQSHFLFSSATPLKYSAAFIAASFNTERKTRRSLAPTFTAALIIFAS